MPRLAHGHLELDFAFEPAFLLRVHANSSAVNRSCNSTSERITRCSRLCNTSVRENLPADESMTTSCQSRGPASSARERLRRLGSRRGRYREEKDAAAAERALD